MLKRWLSNSVLSILSAFFALAFAEGLLAYCLPIATKRFIYDQTRDVFQYHTDRIQFDENAGYITKPNLTLSFANKEFTTLVQTNSLGYRDDEVSCYDPDVLLLGDSFGFGWGVEKDDALEAVLEKESKLKILNMSVSGYNSVQELALLTKWQQTRSLKNKTIILLYYVNDMADNVNSNGNSSPAIQKSNDGIELKNVSEENYKQWISNANYTIGWKLAKRFYTMYYLRNFYSYIHSLFYPNSSIRINSEQQPISIKLRTMRFVLEKLHQISQEENCRLIFTYIPYSPNLRSKKYDTEYFILKYLLSSYDFDLVDLSSRLGKKDYYLIDEHWNTNGHKKAALAIKDYLLKM